jgi:hypothetical protein
LPIDRLKYYFLKGLIAETELVIEKNKDTKSIVLPVGMKAEEVAAMGIPEEGMDEIIDLSGEGNDIE